MQRPAASAPAAPSHGSSTLWIALIAVAVLGVGGIATVVALVGAVKGVSVSGSSAAVGGSNERGLTPAEIAAVDLAATPEVLAKRLGVPVQSNGGVYAKLSGGRFESVGFFWDEKHLEHVSRVNLSALPTGLPADLVERTRAQLGRVLRPASTGGFQYGGDGAGASISSSFSIGAHEFDDPRWKSRVDALFTVLKGAGLGTSDKLDEKSKRDVLNIGYPLARLGEIDFDLPVESAEREMHRVFPGAASANERHDVGIGHPWLDSAMVLWTNAANGKFDRINFYFTPTFDFKAQREDVARCFTPALGAPKVSETNHLAGEATLSFGGGPNAPRVYISNQAILMNPAANRVKASMKELLAMLAACG